MKKILLLFFILITLCGCTKEKEQKEEKKEKKEEVVETTPPTPTYEDQNKTPIAFYSLNGNTLTKLSTIHKNLVVEEDIGVFQIYPSNEEVITLDKNFGESYHDKWLEYNEIQPIKLGFNIKFHLSTGEDVSYNMFTPADMMNRWEHLMNYVYDDYANRGKGFYSHIENDQYQDSTLITALKIQSSYQCGEIDSKISVTVFTYDSEDDFDENGEYRGNSSHTFTICKDGVAC